MRGPPAHARLGAVSFLQRFGSSLNEHWHNHCCVSDGVFVAAHGQTLAFEPATVDAAAVARVRARVRRRVLAAYRRYGVLSAAGAEDMAGWDHGGGFSGDASVGIAADDRPALSQRTAQGLDFTVGATLCRARWLAELATQGRSHRRSVRE